MKKTFLSEVENCEEVVLSSNGKKFILKVVGRGEYSHARIANLCVLQDDLTSVLIKKIGWIKKGVGHEWSTDSVTTIEQVFKKRSIVEGCLVDYQIDFKQAIELAENYITTIQNF